MHRRQRPLVANLDSYAFPEGHRHGPGHTVEKSPVDQEPNRPAVFQEVTARPVTDPGPGDHWRRVTRASGREPPLLRLAPPCVFARLAPKENRGIPLPLWPRLRLR